MIKQRREGRGVYIRSYGQLTVMMPFSYEREKFFSTINTRIVILLELSTTTSTTSMIREVYLDSSSHELSFILYELQFVVLFGNAGLN